ncbi:MAG: hypothetical protein WCJ39_10670 [bacterium]
MDEGLGGGRKIHLHPFGGAVDPPEDVAPLVAAVGVEPFDGGPIPVRLLDARLLEQSGIEEPDRYRAAIEWLDANSRYEGSNIFRRIDGSAERVEMDFAASPQPLVHSSRITAGIENWSGAAGQNVGEP